MIEKGVKIIALQGWMVFDEQSERERGKGGLIKPST
jgi:hypothetical protein